MHPMFIEALFTIVKIWKLPKCPSMEERIKELWYTYHAEWNKPDRERQILFAFSYMWKLKETQDKPIDIENILVVVRGVGCKKCVKGIKRLKRKKKKFTLDKGSRKYVTGKWGWKSVAPEGKFKPQQWVQLLWALEVRIQDPGTKTHKINTF